MTTTDSTFHPWRTDGEHDDLLAEDVGRQWRQLLDESKRCVVDLRQATHNADQRLQVGSRLLKQIDADAGRNRDLIHDRILRQLDMFEQRLDVLESKLSALPPARPAAKLQPPKAA